MTHVTKFELLNAALSAAETSGKMLERAKDYQVVAENINGSIVAELKKPERDKERIQRLILDRDYMLQVVDTNHREAMRHLRRSKRLARKARWARYE
jgi:hypothetical protein